MATFDQTSQFSTDSTLEFNEDYSLNDFYAEVLVGEGIWNEINEDMFSFTFNDPLNNWSNLANTYSVIFYCDNTISIQYLYSIGYNRYKVTTLVLYLLVTLPR